MSAAGLSLDTATRRGVDDDDDAAAAVMRDFTAFRLEVSVAARCGETGIIGDGEPIPADYEWYMMVVVVVGNTRPISFFLCIPKKKKKKNSEARPLSMEKKTLLRRSPKVFPKTKNIGPSG